MLHLPKRELNSKPAACRRIEKVKTHIYLNVIVLLASALAAKRQKDKQESLEKATA